MRRLALLAVGSALVSGCSFLGNAHMAPYEDSPNVGTLHHLDSGLYSGSYDVAHHGATYHSAQSYGSQATSSHCAPVSAPVSTPHSTSCGQSTQSAPVYVRASQPSPTPTYSTAPDRVVSTSPCAAVSPCGSTASYAHSTSYAEPSYAYATHDSAYGYGHDLRGVSYPQSDRGRAYVTFGAQQFEVGDPFVGLQGRLGYQTTRYVGAELEGSFGIIGDDEDFGGVIADRMIENQFAGFVTTLVPVVGDLSLRGRVGYHFTEGSIEQTVAGVTTKAKNTEDGFAWGGGAEFAVDDRNAIRADYTRYHLGSGGEAFDSAALAWVHRF